MAGRGRPPSGVAADDVARLIRDFMVAVDRYRQSAAMQLGVDASGLLALMLLVDDDLTPTALATRLGLTSASVTALVDRLSDAGLVERQPHPDDRRRLFVSLTSTGQQSVGEVEQSLIDVVGRALSGVGARHHSALVRFLRTAADEAAEQSHVLMSD